ncbi:ATP-binding protein [Streptomyces flavalbus]|uniref:ATP-binding protein n=1 Tax=Streptomyces flavalbus TaxID=2665155 RepID=A0ABW2WCT4_9ACTN
MDPNTRGPEDYGHDGDRTAPRPRPPRDSRTPEIVPHTPALARTVRLVTGELLLTVNPVDGSEIEPCPPGERPARPRKLTPDERAETARAARPPVPAGPDGPPLPLLGRQDEREQLVRLLARGRSVRLTGPAGSGRTRLLDLVADDCADLAPDGVVRLNGYRRTADDLLHDLFYAVHDAPLHRPTRDELRELVREIGAVVVVDDLETGGTALDDLLDATPECAFLFAATPDTPAPSADADLEEVALSGLDRAGGLDLLERAVGRPLTEEEANWAGDLWFESEGLPLRFVQAGALLRQRDRLLAGVDAVDEFGVFEDAPPVEAVPHAPVDPTVADDVPLPSLAEGAAPAELLAARLSASARATLRFAVALGGEVPHQAHLPALVGDTHADAALRELLDCALVSPVGSRYRLAAGVRTQLEAAGYDSDLTERASTAAQHYAWWAGHPSVTPERVCAEADAVLAALAVLVPGTTPPAEGEESTTVRLARNAAPAFAAGLHWSAWERALRSGAEASRLAGEVAEQAYFHHELGVLALCEGQLDRARAELEAAIGLRGAVADKRGTVAGRRALALVTDRSGGTALALPGGTGGDEVPAAPHEESVSPAGGVPAAPGSFPALQPPADPVVTHQLPTGPGARHTRGGLRRVAKRNLVAAGAGALLAAVLGTVVTLGATSSNDADSPSDQVGGNPPASQGTDDDLGAEETGQDGDADTGDATSRPSSPGPDGTLGTADDPAPTYSGPMAPRPSGTPSGTQGTGGGRPSSPPTKSPTKSPSTTSRPPTQPTGSTSPDPTPSDSDSPSPSGTETSPEPPTMSTSASGPIEASAEETSPSASEPVM